MNVAVVLLVASFIPVPLYRHIYVLGGSYFHMTGAGDRRPSIHNTLASFIAVASAVVCLALYFGSKHAASCKFGMASSCAQLYSMVQPIILPMTYNESLSENTAFFVAYIVVSLVAMALFLVAATRLKRLTADSG